MEEKYKR